jgi:hypothetical protein
MVSSYRTGFTTAQGICLDMAARLGTLLSRTSFPGMIPPGMFAIGLSNDAPRLVGESPMAVTLVHRY